MQNAKPAEDEFIPDINHKYRQDLLELKGRACSYFQQMTAFDLNFEEDQRRALDIALSLRKKIKSLCKEHLGEEDPEEDSRLKNIEFSLKELNSFKETDIIGSDRTYLALKNTSSYMIGTQSQGIKVIENNSEVYSSKLPVDGAWLCDIIYAKPVNCYLLAYNDRLYRKNIDGQSPFLYMAVRCGPRRGVSCLKVSELHNRLIISKDKKNISAVDLHKIEVEIEVSKDLGNRIVDFRLFGENEDKVVSITVDAFIIFYKLDYSERSGSILDSYEVNRIQERGECGTSIAVCDKGKYVLAEIGGSLFSPICSRMFLLEVSGDRLVKKALIDPYSQSIKQKLALECYGYSKRYLFWVGLSWNENGFAQIYEFDLMKGTLRERVGKKIHHLESHPVKINKFEDEFF